VALVVEEGVAVMGAQVECRVVVVVVLILLLVAMAEQGRLG